ncbi:MAG: hypothetical protein KBD37_06080 [Burkholderiales bacterium]|nr:hypothetical protein [Burkholderiales bacterium]
MKPLSKKIVVNHELLLFENYYVNNNKLGTPNKTEVLLLGRIGQPSLDYSAISTTSRELKIIAETAIFLLTNIDNSKLSLSINDNSLICNRVEIVPNVGDNKGIFINNAINILIVGLDSTTPIGQKNLNDIAVLLPILLRLCQNSLDNHMVEKENISRLGKIISDFDYRDLTVNHALIYSSDPEIKDRAINSLLPNYGNRGMEVLQSYYLQKGNKEEMISAATYFLERPNCQYTNDAALVIYKAFVEPKLPIMTKKEEKTQIICIKHIIKSPIDNNFTEIIKLNCAVKIINLNTKELNKPKDPNVIDLVGIEAIVEEIQAPDCIGKKDVGLALQIIEKNINQNIAQIDHSTLHSIMIRYDIEIESLFKIFTTLAQETQYKNDVAFNLKSRIISNSAFANDQRTIIRACVILYNLNNPQDQVFATNKLLEQYHLLNFDDKGFSFYWVDPERITYLGRTTILSMMINFLERVEYNRDVSNEHDAMTAAVQVEGAKNMLEDRNIADAIQIFKAVYLEIAKDKTYKALLDEYATRANNVAFKILKHFFFSHNAGTISLEELKFIVDLLQSPENLNINHKIYAFIFIIYSNIYDENTTNEAKDLLNNMVTDAAVPHNTKEKIGLLLFTMKKLTTPQNITLEPHELNSAVYLCRHTHNHERRALFYAAKNLLTLKLPKKTDALLLIPGGEAIFNQDYNQILDYKILGGNIILQSQLKDPLVDKYKSNSENMLCQLLLDTSISDKTRAGIYMILSTYAKSSASVGSTISEYEKEIKSMPSNIKAGGSTDIVPPQLLNSTSAPLLSSDSTLEEGHDTISGSTTPLSPHLTMSSTTSGSTSQHSTTPIHSSSTPILNMPQNNNPDKMRALRNKLYKKLHPNTTRSRHSSLGGSGGSSTETSSPSSPLSSSRGGMVSSIKGGSSSLPLTQNNSSAQQNSVTPDVVPQQQEKNKQ